MRWRALAVGVLVFAGACGDAVAPAPTAAYQVRAHRDMAFTSLLDLDVYHPDAAGPWPVVVLVPGGGWDSADRSSTAGFAELLAGRGAVVFNSTYRLDAPEAFADVACAVRYAGEHAGRYGGDPARLVLAGHSAGGHVTAVVALSGDDFGGECTTGSAYVPPPAWAGVAGAYNMEAFQFVPALRRFFGGTLQEEPGAWEIGNPLTYVGRRGDLAVGLIHGRSDIVTFPASTVDLVRAFAESGREVEPVYLDGVDHFEVIDPAVAADATADVILGLVP